MLIDRIAADLLEIAVAEIEIPARVREVGQRHPVPLAGILFLGQVFINRIQHLHFGLAFGAIQRIFRCLLVGHVSKITAFEGRIEPSSRPNWRNIKVVAGAEKLGDMLIDLLIDHVEISVLQLTPSSTRWRYE